MKKVLTGLSLVLVVLITSCSDGVNVKQVEVSSNDTTETVAEVVKDLDAWELSIVKDEFGDPTGDSVYVKLFKGLFSNTAVQNEEMTIKVVDYGDSFLFGIYEYNRNLATISYEHSFGYIKVKTESGEVVKYKTFNMSGSGLYFDSDSDFYKIFRSSKGKEFKIYIDTDSFDSHAGKCNYSFKVTSRK